MSDEYRAVPTGRIEVVYLISRGWLLWHGRIRYRKRLAATGDWGFWMVFEKRPLPLCRARTRHKLMDKLHAEAYAMGHVVSEREEVRVA